MENKIYKIDASGDMIGNIIGGDNNTISGEVAKTINNNSQDDIVKDITQLINDLSQNNPTNSTVEQMAVAGQAIEAIENRPGWRQKAINAFKQGTLEAIKTHPIGAFVVAAIASWKEE